MCVSHSHSTHRVINLHFAAKCMTQQKIINQNAMITKITVAIGILFPKDNGNFADIALKSQTLLRLGGMLSHANTDKMIKKVKFGIINYFYRMKQNLPKETEKLGQKSSVIYEFTC